MFYDIIKSLEKTPGTKAQEAHLMDLADNKLSAEDYSDLRHVLYMMLDPRHTFGITWKGVTQRMHYPEGSGEASTGRTLDMLRAISRREITGNAALDHVCKFMEPLGRKEREVIKWIIDRKNPAKVGKTMVNKVFPGLIYTQPYMGCKPDNPSNRARIKGKRFVQLKVDGLCGMAVSQATGEFFRVYSRQGQIFDLPRRSVTTMWQHIHDLMVCVPYPCMVQGEFICVDENGHPLQRNVSNGIMARMKEGSLTAEDESKIRFVVWDLVPASEYSGTGVTHYSARFDNICEAVRQYEQICIGSPRIELVDYALVDTDEDAQQWVDGILACAKADDIKLEGGVMKTLDGVYKNGKPWWQVKMKGVYECEMEIIDVIPHAEHPDWVGSLVLQSADGEVVNGCGTGFTEEQRKNLMEMHEDGSLVGWICTVRFNEILKPNSKKKTHALGTPCVFKELRIDKVVADTLEEIKEICND